MTAPLEPAWVWTALGIQPTRDLGIIRKAYASQLKIANPEEDPEAFQRLRAAYEAALGLLEFPQRAPLPPRLPEVPRDIGSTSPPQAPFARGPGLDEPPQRSEELETLFKALERQLQSKGGFDAQEFGRTLESLLNGPFAHDIGRWDRLEKRLAGLILGSIPTSDAIAAMVVQRLGWNRSDALRLPTPKVAAVVAHLGELGIVEQLRSGTDPAARAFQLLSRPAPASWWERRRRAFALDDSVQEFLNKWLPRLPLLRFYLDKGSVALWLPIFGRPHVRLRALLFMPGYSVLALGGVWLAAAHGALLPDRLPWVVTLAVLLGPILVLGKLYAFSWPIYLLLTKLRTRRIPLWVGLGWLPVSVAGVMLMGLIGTSLVSGVLAALIALGLLIWASVAAHPVFVAGDLTFWQKLLAAVAHNFPMLIWMALIIWVGGISLAVVTAGALGASAICGGPLREFWSSKASRRFRALLIAALLLATATAFYLLRFPPVEGNQQGFLGLAFTTSAILLQRAFHWQIDQDLTGVRLRAGFWGAFVGRGYFLEGSGLDPQQALHWLQLFLLAGVTVVVAVYLTSSLVSERLKQSLSRLRRFGTGFFDQKSPLIPTVLGVALLLYAGYHLIIRADIDGLQWIWYLLVAGVGAFVLKRTFSVAEG